MACEAPVAFAGQRLKGAQTGEYIGACIVYNTILCELRSHIARQVGDCVGWGERGETHHFVPGQCEK